MQKKCDLYLGEPVRCNLLRPLHIFDSSFSFDPEKTYSGFLRVNIARVKLVSVVLTLRSNKICSFSVPVEYRDQRNIHPEEALFVAVNFARARGESVFPNPNAGPWDPPVFWSFALISDHGPNERAGGVVMVDRLDGHVWDTSEYEEYMYDFNNVI